MIRTRAYQRWIDNAYLRAKTGSRLASHTIRPIPHFEGEEEEQNATSGESATNELRATPGDS